MSSFIKLFIINRFSTLLVGLEKTHGISAEMIPRIPPSVAGFEDNFFILVQYHFGYSIKDDIVGYYDMYNLDESEVDEEANAEVEVEVEVFHYQHNFCL